MNSNVESTEIAKFGDLASRWWDPEGPMRTLHDINPVRLQWLEGHASLSGKRVVDVGCGAGLLAEAMAARGAQVTGVDLAVEVLRVAELHLLETGLNVEYLEESAESLAARVPMSADIVTCMELLEHVPDPASTVTACATLVRPGGQVFFSTINRNPKSFALAIVGAEYVLNLVPRGTHQYAKLIKPSELARFARAAGLDVTEITGMRYNPLARSASLGADTDVNYLMACRRPQ